MTDTPPPAAPQPHPGQPPEETWTMGEAAAYLNGGGVDFGLRPQAVRRMADDPRNQIKTTSRGTGRWRRALASTVRAERARMLHELGRVDPAYPPPAAPAAVEEEGPQA